MTQTIIRGLIILLLLTWPLGSVEAAKIALHATDSEKTIWNARRVSGTATQIMEWNIILSRANTFKNDPNTAKVWPGNTGTGAWPRGAEETCFRDAQDNAISYPGAAYAGDDCGASNRGVREYYNKVRDAAFVYMLTGDTTYRTPVVNYLLAQTNTSTNPGTNFANTTRWPRGTYTEADKDFEISIWTRNIVTAYSYVRSSMTGPQQTAIDQWFVEIGRWFEAMLQVKVSGLFPNRLSFPPEANYTTTKSSGNALGLTHFGGRTARNIQYGWDNKSQNHNAAIAAIAVVANNAALKSIAKRHFMESIRYGMWSDGTYFEQHRWNGGTPQNGWEYLTASLGALITIADHFARDGDTSLYTYTTSGGIYGTEGGSKNLLLGLRLLANMTLGNTIRYASNSSTSNSTLIIDATGSGNYVGDVSLAMANVFYQDALLTSSYSRSMPSNPTGGTYRFSGDWAAPVPAMRFMFGGTEGVVSAAELYGQAPSCPEGQTLVGYYSFDNTPNDSSGLTLHGTFTGSSYTSTAGEFVAGTHAGVFNAAADVFTFPTTCFAMSQFTITGWWRPTAFSAIHYWLGHTSCPPSACDRVQWYTDDTTGLLDVGLGSNHSVALGTVDLAINTWYYGAFVVSGNTYRTIILARDAGTAVGMEKASGSISGLAVAGPTFALGNNLLSNNQGFLGQVDEVRVYSTVRTDAEILADFNLHNTGSDLTDDPPPDPADLVPCTIASCVVGNGVDTSGNNRIAAVCDDPTPDILDPEEVSAQLSSYTVTVDGVNRSIQGANLNGLNISFTIAPSLESSGLVTRLLRAASTDPVLAAQNELCTDNAVSPVPEPGSLEVAGFQCQSVGYTQRFCAATNADFGIPPGGRFILLSRIYNGDITATDPQTYSVWCGVGSPTTRVTTETCSTLGLCYDPTTPYSKPGQSSPENGDQTTELFSGDGTFTVGGAYKSNDQGAVSQVIPAGGAMIFGEILKMDTSATIGGSRTCGIFSGEGAQIGDATVAITVARPGQF